VCACEEEKLMLEKGWGRFHSLGGDLPKGKPSVQGPVDDFTPRDRKANSIAKGGRFWSCITRYRESEFDARGQTLVHREIIVLHTIKLVGTCILRALVGRNTSREDSSASVRSNASCAVISSTSCCTSHRAGCGDGGTWIQKTPTTRRLQRTSDA